MPRFCNVEITNMSESIDHTGVIEKIEDNTIFVKIVQESACSGCHAQGMCSASESKDKIIEITDYSGLFQVNEQVRICGQSSLGLQAVLLAFVIPLALVVLAIAIGTCMQWKETISGLSGLLLLFPYYCILYVLRDRLKRRFIFTLKKLN